MYSPKIEEALVKKLYLLKQISKRPMTKLVNEAIMEYLIKKEKSSEREENSRIGAHIS